ncbi:Protein CBG18751 [Caenorhabditis briggsae]|uniref:Protein CBG18751 n=4 Tax=Caenorhabditis briggsae TaxID=6238 RepID=A8XU18_CAEBR|nr:Protein CBG18751 [Caenorhabditis briggsae]ULT93603.1 hypothetical protein L3Y34_003238 [Caenorhabditis briggsae]CAP36145.2 Protein CBG18751 [Caenorhabditis briggsae]
MRSIKFLLLLFLMAEIQGSMDDGSGDAFYPDDIAIEGSGAPPHNISTIAEEPREGEASGGPMIPPHPNKGSGFEYGGSDDPGPDFEGSGKPENPQTAEPLPPVIDDLITGIPEESTMPPKDPAEFQTHEAEQEPEEGPTGPTTPFDIDNLETGVPEGPTKEPYMPKPVTKPKPGSNQSEEGVTDGYYSSGGTDFTDFTDGGSSEMPMESIPPVHWTKSTPRDFTISQKIDQNSPGYQQLLHMLEDLGHRRKQEDIVQATMTDFYVSRATSLMDTIDNSFTNVAISNITMAQEYVKGLLEDSSVSVRNAYTEIVKLTKEPSFYYIPKRQRYLMVHKIVTDMDKSAQQEMLALNKQAKTYCRNANVDTPPYSLGNIFGNMLANGAVLTK